MEVKHGIRLIDACPYCLKLMEEIDRMQMKLDARITMTQYFRNMTELERAGFLVRDKKQAKKMFPKIKKKKIKRFCAIPDSNNLSKAYAKKYGGVPSGD